MAKFVYSDPHFGHVGITKFIRSDGVTPVRPWNDLESMHKALIENWNSVVGLNDEVILVGDAVWSFEWLGILEELNGSKVLVAGNHDKLDTRAYLRHFSKVVGALVLGNRVFTHYPIHPSNIEFRIKQNVHGHMHEKRVLLPDGNPDPRYVNVSVECINYTPLAFDQLPKIL